MTESDVKTVKGISIEECKEKLWKEYRHDYKIIDQRDDFENYGPFRLFKRPIKVVRYVPYRKSYNPDNYFIHNRTEEDELVNELDINSVKIATAFLGKYLEG